MYVLQIGSWWVRSRREFTIFTDLMERNCCISPVHCSNCFIPSRCIIDNINFCPLVKCPRFCGHRLHSCKVTEHCEEVCSRQYISCPNVRWGCSVEVERGRLWKHLEKCPAYNVVCMQAWCRFKSKDPSSERKPGPDMEFCRQDQELLNKTRFSLNDKEKYLEYSTSPLFPLRICGEKPKVEEIVLNPTLEFYAKEAPKPTDLFSFSCASTFHRSEITDHIGHIHTAIIPDLNDGIIKRCPLAIYGCPYYEVGRLAVNDKIQKTVSFSRDMQCFYTRDTYTSNNGSPFQFLSLPTFIIRHICTYLDGFSLNSLSMTSKIARSVVADQLSSKGLIEPIWRQIPGTKRWEHNGFRLFFSKTFEPVQGWTLLNSGIAEHLKNCKFNDRSVKTEPFHLLL